MKYGEGAPKPATQRGAKSNSSTVGSAGRQAGAAKRLFAVFDIDGTLIRWQLYHSVADTLARLGHIDSQAHQAVKQARMDWKRRAEGSSFADYERQVITLYDQAIRALTQDQFNQAAEAVFDEYKDQVYTYTRDLIKELKTKGYLLFAISGSQAEIVAKIAAYYQMDDYRGSIYESVGGRYTGAKEVASWHKDKVLDEMVEQYGATFEDSLAIGDSKSDIAMLEKVAKPIAFNPEEELFKYAATKGWKIVVERKNMVYELEQVNGTYQLVTTNG